MDILKALRLEMIRIAKLRGLKVIDVKATKEPFNPKSWLGLPQFKNVD